jgi:hypothetical protein
MHSAMPGASDQSNIIRLYEELGVRPGDGLERLTERYRQRLRELHPDSRVDTGQMQAVGDGSDNLGWLTRSYREASAFAREHGRLPGADAGFGAGPAQSSRTRPGGTAMPGLGPRRMGARRRRGGGVPLHSGWRWVIAAITIVVVVLVAVPELLEPPDVTPFNRDLGAPPQVALPLPAARRPMPAEDGRPAAREASVQPSGATAAPTVIRIGSSMDDVLRIQGAPTLQEEDVWQYGPSFVRFHDGRVRDWHSSPLQPLRVATPR